MTKKRTLKILVVDDTPQILMLLEMHLKQLGHLPLKAKNGKEALDTALQEKPDLILLDIMMPVMNGLEALEEIKKHTPSTPVAMISASTANAHLKQALKRGAIGYISKPVKFNELDLLINEIIQKNELQETQMRMQEMSRLAALGEMVGHVAHEVLNPLTALLSKIETMIKDQTKTQEAGLGVIQTITGEWKQKYVSGELSSYLDKKIPGHERGFNHAQEDFSDIDTITNELLKMREKGLEELKFLQRHLIRINKIINNLRTLARKSETLEETDINKILKDTKELLRDTLWKRGINIVENYDKNLPKVMVDPDELMQVFTNITKNAADAIEMRSDIPLDEKKIIYHTTHNHGKVLIRVVDKGVGIPKDKWESIFDSSFTTKDRTKGTGLGLSISRRLIRNFDGDILVEASDPKKGTVILVWLPTE